MANKTRKSFKKSTPEEVLEMRRLYDEEKMSYMAISRKMKKDHTVIMYWIKKGKIPVRNQQEQNQVTRTMRKEIWEKKRQIKIEEERKQRKRNITYCLSCKKLKKNAKWIRTRFCGLICWDGYFTIGLPKEKRFNNCPTSW